MARTVTPSSPRNHDSLTVEAKPYRSTGTEGGWATGDDATTAEDGPGNVHPGKLGGVTELTGVCPAPRAGVWLAVLVTTGPKGKTVRQVPIGAYPDRASALAYAQQADLTQAQPTDAWLAERARPLPDSTQPSPSA